MKNKTNRILSLRSRKCISIRRYWLGPSDEYGTFLYCIPLAPTCLAISGAFAVWGAFNIKDSVKYGGISWDDTGDLIVGVFKIIVGAGGFAAVLFKSTAGVHFLTVGYNVFLVSTSVASITKWLEWIMAMCGNTTVDGIPWKPKRNDKIYMTLYTIDFFLLLLLSCIFIVGAIHSLRMVLSVGGTGWESLNYLEVLEKKQNLREKAEHHGEYFAENIFCSVDET